MKANELRVGNWVTSEETPFKVDHSAIYQMKEFKHTHLKPIPLTEESIARFKTVKRSDNYVDIKKNNFVIRVGLNGNPTLLFIGNGLQILPCEYVHQLQNLFFALTGEEL